MTRLLATTSASALGSDAELRIGAAGAIRPSKHYLIASDFDQTLSFNDSGEVLSELLGRPGFKDKVDGLAGAHLVQQGGELAYLLLHDPEYRCVRRGRPAAGGNGLRLKRDIAALHWAV